jgi:hypothetical protein
MKKTEKEIGGRGGGERERERDLCNSKSSSAQASILKKDLKNVLHAPHMSHKALGSGKMNQTFHRSLTIQQINHDPTHNIVLT